MDERIYNALRDPNVTFFILATPTLLTMIEKNEHPFIQALPIQIKTEFLAGHGWSIEPDMVIKYLEGKLDEKNAFLLKHGEIRVFGAEEIALKNVK